LCVNFCNSNETIYFSIYFVRLVLFSFSFTRWATLESITELLLSSESSYFLHFRNLWLAADFLLCSLSSTSLVCTVGFCSQLILTSSTFIYHLKNFRYLHTHFHCLPHGHFQILVFGFIFSKLYFLILKLDFVHQFWSILCFFRAYDCEVLSIVEQLIFYCWHRLTEDWSLLKFY
jgi:hypothetical protein